MGYIKYNNTIITSVNNIPSSGTMYYICEEYSAAVIKNTLYISGKKALPGEYIFRLEDGSFKFIVDENYILRFGGVIYE